jgi:hypothetical protein
VDPREPGMNVLDASEVLAHRDTVIWRYMNLPKFISMLDTQALYFSNLGTFIDHHEGALSKPALERIIQERMESARARKGRPLSEQEIEWVRERAMLAEAAVTKMKREHVLANCWYRSPVESGALGTIYGKDSVAIRSTIGKLYDCTRYHSPNIMIQFVHYVDHAVQDFDAEESFLFKHPLFAHEQEVRALMLIGPKLAAPPSLSVRVELPALIEAVHLAPGAAQLHSGVIESLLLRYDLPSVPVVRSEADTSPEYRQKLDEFVKRLNGDSLETVISELNARDRK